MAAEGRAAEAASAERRVLEEASDETIMKELCAASGCNYERMLDKGKDEKITKIEIFFFGYPRIACLHHFPNLTTLCIINQPIRSLAGLESCDRLTELWICEAKITDMRKVESCTGLQTLYLYSNKIERIQGLEKLVKLKKLWLNDNSLGSAEGLENQEKLRDLNLAGNCVRSVRGCVEHLDQLETLDLSGNLLSSFDELSPLSELSSLRSLSLSHPHYPPNPLSLLCNTSSLLLFSLPQLTSLDGQDVSSPEIKHIVKGLVLKKKMFYRMRMKHEQEVIDRKCHTHRQEMKQLQEVIYRRLRTLHVALGELERYSRVEKEDHVDEEEEEEEKKEKLKLIKGRIIALSSYLEYINATSTAYLDQLQKTLSYNVRLLQVELDSGGNVKFTTTPEAAGVRWYQACIDLVKSRFSVSNWQEFGFSGVEVTNVLRVENRRLQNNLMSTVQTILKESGPDSIPTSNDLCDLVEYLFLIWHPDQDLVKISTDGFNNNVPVQLTDSILLSDLPRFQHSSTSTSTSSPHTSPADQTSHHHKGLLLLCKVFKGQHKKITNPGIPSAKTHQKVHSVCRPTNSHSKEWFVFHSDLVVPSFLISLNYLSPVSKGSKTKSVVDHMTSRDPNSPSDDVILDHTPLLPDHPKLALLDEASLLSLTQTSNLSDIKDLCLHGNHLTRFRLSPCPSPLTHSLLPSLVSLSLSCNDIHTTEDFQNMVSLTRLDLSYNRITSLEGIKNLPRLGHLDVCGNSLSCYFSDVAILRKHTPSLVSFDARYNSWHKPELFRIHALNRLKTLKHLDNQPVTPDNTSSSSALAYTGNYHLTLSSLHHHHHIITLHTLPPSLSLSFTTYNQLRPSKASNFTNHINEWGSKVTGLHMPDQRIRRLNCFDQLPNLHWLCLDANNISNIEPLSLCQELEEVSIERNLVTDLSPLSSLPHLKVVMADHNRVASLPEPSKLGSLSKLTLLSLCHNHLTQLAGLENLSSLQELYLSSNDIHDRRQLFHLKPIRSLLLLSLEHNPITTSVQEVGVAVGGVNTYRMFVVYHLQSLKSLDGIPLEQTEIVSAKEKMDGRLSQDLIYEQSPTLILPDTHTLNLSNCGVKSVDLSPVDILRNLVSLNLEQNNLTSLSGLIHLHQLKVLCLNNNKIGCLLPKEVLGGERLPVTTIMRSLEVLHLAYNGISNMVQLHLHSLPSLRALFLQGNDIGRVEGLKGLTRLTELVLDRNRIKGFGESSFVEMSSLRVLLVEENRLRSLSYLDSLPSLERLFLGGNKIQDYSEIDKLHPLTGLLELSLLDNPVSRRHQHRPITIFNLPSLLSLDGIRVTSQEKQNAQAIFSIDNEQDLVEIPLPGIPNRPAHLRVMNVPFAHSPRDHTHNHHDNRRHGNNRR